MAIKFRQKGLAEFWAKGAKKGIRPELASRIARCLQILAAAETLDNVNAVTSLRLHHLNATPVRWSVWANGAWRITFKWEGGHAINVDLEQYH